MTNGLIYLDVIVAITITTFSVAFFLFVFAMASRAAKVYADKKREQKYKDHSKAYVKYIAGDLAINELNTILDGRTDLIRTYFSICKDLQFNLRGTERERIQAFLRTKAVCDFYKKQILSGLELRIIEGLNYYKELELLDADQRKVIAPLIEHKKSYIRYGAATAMMACDKVKDRGHALEVICKEEKLTRLALFELLYKFRNKDKEQWEQEGKFLTGLLLNEEVLNKHKSTVAIAMGGMGYYYESKAMLSYLQEQPLTDENAPLVAGLIEGLGMLKSPFTIDEIERIISQTDNSLIKKACMNALREINGKEGIELLFKMLGLDYEPQVQIDSAIEIIKLDLRSLQSISSGMIPDNVNKELVSKIESETGHNFYLNTA